MPYGTWRPAKGSLHNLLPTQSAKWNRFYSIKEAEKGSNWQAWTFMCRVTLQEWKVPEVSTCLRWSQRGDCLWNSPALRALLSIKSTWFVLLQKFLWYPMGIWWLPAKYHKNFLTNDVGHLKKWNAHTCRHSVFQNALWDSTVCNCTSKIHQEKS